jgi:hypothetical protein
LRGGKGVPLPSSPQLPNQTNAVLSKQLSCRVQFRGFSPPTANCQQQLRTSNIQPEELGYARAAGPPEAKSAQERPGGTHDNRHTQPGRVRAAGHVYADDHQKFAVGGLARWSGVLPERNIERERDQVRAAHRQCSDPGWRGHSHSLCRGSPPGASPTPTQARPSHVYVCCKRALRWIL